MASGKPDRCPSTRALRRTYCTTTSFMRGSSTRLAERPTMARPRAGTSVPHPPRRRTRTHRTRPRRSRFPRRRCCGYPGCPRPMTARYGHPTIPCLPRNDRKDSPPCWPGRPAASPPRRCHAMRSRLSLTASIRRPSKARFIASGSKPTGRPLTKPAGVCATITVG